LVSLTKQFPANLKKVISKENGDPSPRPAQQAMPLFTGKPRTDWQINAGTQAPIYKPPAKH